MTILWSANDSCIVGVCMSFVKWCEQVSSGSMSLNNFTDMYKNEVEEQFAEWLELHKTHDDKECKQLEELRKAGYIPLFH